MARRLEPLGTPFRFLVGCVFLSSLGSGLTFPFTAIYISGHLRLGSSAAAAYFGVVAVTSFCTGISGGQVTDRFGARVAGSSGTAVLALSYAGLGFTAHLPGVLLSAAGVGVGNGLFFPALAPLVAGMVPEALRRRAFALRYVAMNVGIGAGATVASLTLASLDSDAGFRWLYSLNALSFLPLAALVLRYGPPPSPRARDAPAGYRALAHRRVVLLIAVQGLIAMFGYSQFEATVPVVIHDSMSMSTGFLGVVVAANTTAVAVLQRPVVRWLDRFSEPATLALGTAVWSAAFLCGAAAALSHGWARTPALVLFAVLFAVGETAYASSLHPLLVRLAPPHALGRAGALGSLAWNVGSMIGPALGLLVVARAAAPVSWGCLAAAALAPTALSLHLRRVVRVPEGDGAGTAGGGPGTGGPGSLALSATGQPATAARGPRE